MHHYQSVISKKTQLIHKYKFHLEKEKKVLLITISNNGIRIGINYMLMMKQKLFKRAITSTFIAFLYFMTHPNLKI